MTMATLLLIQHAVEEKDPNKKKKLLADAIESLALTWIAIQRTFGGRPHRTWARQSLEKVGLAKKLKDEEYWQTDEQLVKKAYDWVMEKYEINKDG